MSNFNRQYEYITMAAATVGMGLFFLTLLLSSEYTHVLFDY